MVDANNTIKPTEPESKLKLIYEEISNAEWLDGWRPNPMTGKKEKVAERGADGTRPEGHDPFVKCGNTACPYCYPEKPAWPPADAQVATQHGVTRWYVLFPYPSRSYDVIELPALGHGDARDDAHAEAHNRHKNGYSTIHTEAEWEKMPQSKEFSRIS